METFVVRVWTPADGRGDEPGQPLRGVVEHIGSGQSGHFQGEEQLLELIRMGLVRRDSQGQREEVRYESKS
jgi:hypothetical protein